MIRFNLLAPELHETKQYDVLGGFAFWCSITGFFLFICMLPSLLLMLVALQFLSGLPGLFLVLFNILLFFISQFFLGLGKAITESHLATLSYLKSYRIPAIASTSVFAVLFLIAMLDFGTTNYWIEATYVWGAGIPICIFILFVICIFFLLEKTFRQAGVEKIRGVKPVLSETADEIVEPNVITLYEKWDPLSAYGKLLLCFGVFIECLTVILFHLKMIDLSIRDESRIVFVFAILVAICGLGLAKLKEWARVMNIILHAAIILFPIMFAISLLFNSGARQTEIFIVVVIGLFLAIPIIHWCFFVVKTLSSPVVKYVCIRGGDEID